MATDPPYGVQYDPAWRHRVNPSQRTAVGRVTNDDRADWTAGVAAVSAARVAYVWHAGLKAADRRGRSRSGRLHRCAARSSGSSSTSRSVEGTTTGGTSRLGMPCAAKVSGSAIDARRRVWEVPNLNPMGGHACRRQRCDRATARRNPCGCSRSRSSTTRRPATPSTTRSVAAARRSSPRKNSDGPATRWKLIRSMSRPRSLAGRRLPASGSRDRGPDPITRRRP